MHRTHDPNRSPFDRPERFGTYLVTALVALFLVLDLAPLLVMYCRQWELELGLDLTRQWRGIRYASIAAGIGLARWLYLTLEEQGTNRAEVAGSLAVIAALLLGESVAAAEVVCIGLLGETLELFVIDRTSRALRTVTELFPTRCWVLREGQECRTFVADLQVGDEVVIKPGGKIPVDGTVISGRCEVDLAALTGESQPVVRDIGESVLAGSVVRLGSLVVRAERLAEATLAGGIVTATASALKEKGEGGRIADRWASRFLPVVLVVAILAFLGNTLRFHYLGSERPALAALYPALAVLVAACPCPLLLAVPAAMMAALGRLAGTGILIKRLSALERLAESTTFAFDKTGTLTHGEPSVTIAWSQVPEDELLRVAATAERRSEHPYARAILNGAAQRKLILDDIDSFEAIPGCGIRTKTSSGLLRVGSPSWMRDEGVSLPEIATSGTTLVVSRESDVLGLLTLKDSLRPEAYEVVAALRGLGISRMVLLTGDRESAAREVLESLPLDEIHAEQKPLEKLAWVEKTPHCVMVGDGINDAPALAAASVGIAVGQAGELTARAGDIVILGEPLRHLPFLLRLARETTLTVRRGLLVFGLGVNLVGAILAGIILPLCYATNLDSFPLLAAIYHQVGSFGVLLLSARLLFFERSPGKNARWSRLQSAIDQKLHAFSPEAVIHWASHRSRELLLAALVLVAVLWGTSGLVTIEPGEVGIVKRFGAVVDRLEPGLHWRRPLPMETITRLSIDRPRLVEIGYRTHSQELIQVGFQEQERLRQTLGKPPLDWAAVHGERTEKISDESLFPTGDGALVELAATLEWRIENPEHFLLTTESPEELLRAEALAVLRELSGTQTTPALLATGRTELTVAAEKRLMARMKQLDLGIRIVALVIHDLHPLSETVAAYHATAIASQKRDQMQEESERSALLVRSNARDAARSSHLLTEAETHARIATEASEQDVFRSLLAARRSPGGKAHDLRRTLDAVIEAVGNRPKVWIDAAELPGRKIILPPDVELPIPR